MDLDTAISNTTTFLDFTISAGNTTRASVCSYAREMVGHQFLFGILVKVKEMAEEQSLHIVAFILPAAPGGCRGRSQH